jgi:hypothetical protein
MNRVAQWIVEFGSKVGLLLPMYSLDPYLVKNLDLGNIDLNIYKLY